MITLPIAKVVLALIYTVLAVLCLVACVALPSLKGSLVQTEAELQRTLDSMYAAKSKGYLQRWTSLVIYIILQRAITKVVFGPLFIKYLARFRPLRLLLPKVLLHPKLLSNLGNRIQRRIEHHW